MLGACKNETIQILDARRLSGAAPNVSRELAKLEPVSLSLTISPQSLEHVSRAKFILHRCSPSDERFGVTELYLGHRQIGSSVAMGISSKQWLNDRADKAPVTLTAVAPRRWIDDEDYLCGHFEHDQLTDWFSDPRVSAVVRFPPIWRQPSAIPPDLVPTIARRCSLQESDYSWRSLPDRISLMVQGADEASANRAGRCLVQGLRKARVRAGYGSIVLSAASAAR